jgi:hypothetical protein
MLAATLRRIAGDLAPAMTSLEAAAPVLQLLDS